MRSFSDSEPNFEGEPPAFARQEEFLQKMKILPLEISLPATNVEIVALSEVLCNGKILPVPQETVDSDGNIISAENQIMRQY